MNHIVITFYAHYFHTVQYSILVCIAKMFCCIYLSEKTVELTVIKLLR